MTLPESRPCLARSLIPVALLGLSGPTSPPQLDTPHPTRDAAAVIGVRDGVARFRISPDDDGRLVVIISALGNSRTSYPVSISLAQQPGPATLSVSPPLVAITPYRPRPDPRPVADHLVIPVAATIPRAGPRRVFDVPLLNGRPLNNGGSVRVLARPAAEKYVAENDKARHMYFRRFFDVQPGDPLRYHLLVNLDRLDVARAAKVVVEAARPSA